MGQHFHVRKAFLFVVCLGIVALVTGCGDSGSSSNTSSNAPVGFSVSDITGAPITPAYTSPASNLPVTVPTSPVHMPEPSTMMLLAAALSMPGLQWVKCRLRKRT